MSKRRELEDLLESIGATLVRHGVDDVWQIGKRIVTLGHAITKDRQFQNYRAKILRTAREEGLLPPRRESVLPPVSSAREGKRLAHMARHARHAPPATSEEIIAWNIAEDAGWRSAQRGGGDMEEEEAGIAARPRAMGVNERLPLIDRALRESDRPLTPMEVCRYLGWGETADYRAVLNILRSYPGKYQPTGKLRRRERYGLRQAEKEPGSRAAPPTAGETGGVIPEAPARLPGGALQPETPSATADLVHALKRIRAVVDEAVAANIDPMRAAFALGRIAEIVGVVPLSRPAAE